jgi:amidase
MAPVTVEESGAFVASFDVAPTGAGPLDGLTFAVKDLIDVAGRVAGCGNPSWRDSHPPASVHAVAVEQLLRAGARLVGATVSDELAFSLLGQNPFYGTPLNPRARDRVPGGSSSGSASAVACELCDFALGTDTGGSVRVPASNCGLVGWRPSHGAISLAGVMPFAPGFDTVGVLARDAALLARVASVLLGGIPAAEAEPETIYVVRDAFNLADADVRDALGEALEQLRLRFSVDELSLHDLDEDGADLNLFRETFSVIQWSEIESSLGGWIAAFKPALGAEAAANFELTRTLDRRRLGDAISRRERLARALGRRLAPRACLCLPTTPSLAPRKGERLVRTGEQSGYYPRLLALTSIAGVARLPQVSLPVAQVGNIPVGLSLVGARGEDVFLLALANRLTGS